jgi:predicted RNA binding protein YcfA (HicA-like mRNA interferase family)
MAKTQYKTVDTSTLEGLKQAERLKANGWTIDRVGLHLVWFHRKASHTIFWHPKHAGPFTCPDCGGDCETLLAALKTSLVGGAR